MVQTLIVLLLVAVAVFFAVRRIVRTARGKGSCHCDCHNCPHRCP